MDDAKKPNHDAIRSLANMSNTRVEEIGVKPEPVYIVIGSSTGYNEARAIIGMITRHKLEDQVVILDPDNEKDKQLIESRGMSVVNAHDGLAAVDLIQDMFDITKLGVNAQPELTGKQKRRINRSNARKSGKKRKYGY